MTNIVHVSAVPSARKRRLLVTLALVMGLTLAGGAAPAFASTTDTTTIVTQTNAARVAKGLPALKRNAAMDSVAQAWAQKMAVSGYKHNPNYSSQIPAGWTIASENIAMGFASSTVVKAWLNSPGHYANIMRAHTDIGVGFFVGTDGTAYSVQNFATYKSLTAAPTPTISGTVRVGQILTANVGAWAPAPVALTYQWKRGGVAISGATSKSYKVTTSDRAKSLTVTVTGKKTAYSTLSRTSKGTAAVS